MDRIELPFSPLNRSRHLSRGGFVVGKQDWLTLDVRSQIPSRNSSLVFIPKKLSPV